MKKILEAVEILKNDKKNTLPLLSFYQKILTQQEKIKEKFYLEISPEEKKIYQKRNEESKPMLKKDNFKIDWHLFNQLIKTLIQIHEEQTEFKKEKPALEKFSASLEKKDWSLILLAYIFNEEVPEENLLGKNLSPSLPLFSYLITQTFVPFFIKYQEALRGELKLKTWYRNICPVCGRRAYMAYLEKEKGEKILGCNLCFMEWPYKRLKCVFCGNEEQEKLQFFYLEKREYERVDLCERCKCYLKTLDARKSPRQIILPLDDILTTHLDLLAKKEGYHHPEEIS